MSQKLQTLKRLRFKREFGTYIADTVLLLQVLSRMITSALRSRRSTESHFFTTSSSVIFVIQNEAFMGDQKH